jgi:hypothetical protein
LEKIRKQKLMLDKVPKKTGKERKKGVFFSQVL